MSLLRSFPMFNFLCYNDISLSGFVLTINMVQTLNGEALFLIELLFTFYILCLSLGSIYTMTVSFY